MSAAACFLCEQEALYEVYGECHDNRAAVNSRRCAELHRGACRNCLKPDTVENDDMDFCRPCASRQFLCVVCCVIHRNTDGLDVVCRPAAIGANKCRAHESWCPTCLIYRTQAPNDLACGKCARAGLTPVWGPQDVDGGVLKKTKMICQMNNICGSTTCDCVQCSQWGTWLAKSLRVFPLPAPPTEQEERMVERRKRQREWDFDMRDMLAAL